MGAWNVRKEQWRKALFASNSESYSTRHKFSSDSWVCLFYCYFKILRALRCTQIGTGGTLIFMSELKITIVYDDYKLCNWIMLKLFRSPAFKSSQGPGRGELKARVRVGQWVQKY